ncbi:hypothetical protein G647_10201 [Cladophialophora carrionii CBS 160.54]|uniref:Transcription factor domain-containing protein n=1 Tax=Cladophialophora carrionii CBS 160.54 TaxID=1279043 RepID=V9DJ59_9EURO|nr:uncharacterized protein G647_10201 [Cladophialophora carrionii CBS 160.54]ETI26756.1 hypothetical protein G647_10201 [Cladophialophora carrionii CBS 160.54]
MAVESPALLSALIAWTSAHLSCFEKSHRLSALQYQSSAIISLASSLKSSPPTSLDTTLAACLVLCATEALAGDTQRWYDHLKGARDIILSARLPGPNGTTLAGPECFMRSTDGEWLLRNFAYHDVLASVTLNQPPLIRGAYWLRDSGPVFDSYMGVGEGLLALLSRISCLQGEDRVVSDLEFYSQAASLEFELDHWTSPLCSTEAVIALAEAYRGAALLHLHRQCRDRFPADAGAVEAKIQTQVHNILSHLDRIPLESLPECGILLPLFMAGGEALEEAHRHKISSRLRYLAEHRGFQNIEHSIDILEELWRMRLLGQSGRDGQSIDWRDVLLIKNWKVMLT